MPGTLRRKQAQHQKFSKDFMGIKFTKKQRGFVKDYLDTGVGSLAAKKNFDISKKNGLKRYDDTARSIAVEYLSKPHIEQAIQNHAGDAESMVYKLSQKAKAEVVRLNASKDILDRAGYKPIERSESKSTSVSIEARIFDNPELLALDREYEEKIREIYAKGKAN